ncbi:glutathione-dependent formaldehyde-activating, GFA [Atractiella rhizophila]|nr:glutathione-dependent formaldehyde-activating, GFA [Atractiella rhizophila]
MSQLQSESPSQASNWRLAPPYKRPRPSDFDPLYKATCHCGRIQYEIGREKPLNTKYCHCTSCQTMHGAPFQWAAIFEKDDLFFVSGQEDLVAYNSTKKELSHELPTKISCGYCRAPILDEGRNMFLIFPTLIKFKDRKEQEKFQPACHIFYQQRVLDVKDGKPKWRKLDEQSEKMEEDEELSPELPHL